MSAERLRDRIVLITGASRGIGAAVAKTFAAEGAQTILVARNQGALEEVDDEIRAGGGAATLFPCDLTDFDLIDRMGAAIFERFGRLDALVGNAGMLGPLSPMSHVDPEAFDQVMATNLTVNFRLIRSFEPLLRLSEAGRAIFVTSGASDGRHAYWGPYAISKGALEVMVRTWAVELAETPIRVNLINPGGVATRMRAEAFPGEDPATLPRPEEVAKVFVPLAAPDCTRHGEIVSARAEMASAG